MNRVNVWQLMDAAYLSHMNTSMENCLTFSMGCLDAPIWIPTGSHVRSEIKINNSDTLDVPHMNFSKENNALRNQFM